MKKLLFIVVVCLFAFVWAGAQADIPKLINYQGMLTDESGGPLDGTPDITFRIYNAPSGGTMRWDETHYSVPVTDGLFNVILGSESGGIDVDFSEEYWLEIEVNNDTMPERLQFTSMGYAYRAMVADSALATTPGSGSNWHLSSDVLFTNGYWGIARYGNTSYGYYDSTHVNLGVTCTTGALGQNYKYCTVAGGMGNKASNYRATVGGGLHNIASGHNATVGGGEDNRAGGTDATVGGGVSNQASGEEATVGGGVGNSASGGYATVGGGHSNSASNHRATVGGGVSNIASSTDATVGGGNDNTASSEYATVGGGGDNAASAWCATVGGGGSNTASSDRATVGGGASNAASGSYATVPGGWADTAAGSYSLAAGYKVRITSDGDYTFAFGRDFTTSTPNAVIFHNSVNAIKVGIGTTDPEYKLDVRGNRIRLKEDATGQWIAVRTDGNDLDLQFEGGDLFIGSTTAGEHILLNPVTNSNVGIGTTDPNYKLDVNGDINVAGSYNVKKGGVNYSHPDYVFEPDYQLMSLEELKKYVREHKCLPNVVSAEEVKKNEGFKIDELLIQMLEKIEEQTLYIFQLEERIAKLEKKQ